MSERMESGEQQNSIDEEELEDLEELLEERRRERQRPGRGGADKFTRDERLDLADEFLST